MSDPYPEDSELAEDIDVALRLRKAARQSVATEDPTPYTSVPVSPAGLRIHASELCVLDRHCVFHKPSEHHMREWPINVRLDRFGALAERICPHGIGHPDPDSLAYIESLRKADERGYEGVHGCDRCCAKP